MLDQSLEQIENDYWGEPTYPSQLVKICHKIRTIPLKDLTAEHLRMAIGQKISLPILMPLAIQILLNDPLIEAHFLMEICFKMFCVVMNTLVRIKLLELNFAGFARKR